MSKRGNDYLPPHLQRLAKWKGVTMPDDPRTWTTQDVADVSLTSGGKKRRQRIIERAIREYEEEKKTIEQP